MKLTVTIELDVPNTWGLSVEEFTDITAQQISDGELYLDDLIGTYEHDIKVTGSD